MWIFFLLENELPEVIMGLIPEVLLKGRSL